MRIGRNGAVLFAGLLALTLWGASVSVMGKMEVNRGTWDFSDASHQQFNRLMEQEFVTAQPVKTQPEFAQRLLAVAQFFVGSPYKAHLLEQKMNLEERLVLNLTDFDCVTYVETTLALTRMLHAGASVPNFFAENLEIIRYRDGQRQGYASRLHYFSDWLNDAERKGWVKQMPGPDTLEKSLHLLSQKMTKKIPALEMATLRATEIALSREPLRYYRCGHSIKQFTDTLQDGDIVGFVSKEPNLDITHVGFAVGRNKTWHLLNAPSPGKKVTVSRYTLPEACDLYSKTLAGFVLARPQLPKRS